MVRENTIFKAMVIQIGQKNTMQPIRSEQHREIAHDPWNGTEMVMDDKRVEHQLGPSGGIESSHTTHRMASGCGHLRPAAGFCAECLATACDACFGFCDVCRKALCLRHSVFDDAAASNRRQCQSCHDNQRRLRIWSLFGRWLSSLFVDFENSNGRQ